MKAVVVGSLSGISAAIVMLCLGNRAPAPLVREIPIYGTGHYLPLAADYLASTQPSVVDQRLARVLARVKCDDMQLEKFVVWISEATQTNFYIEWHDLAESAAGADSLITLDLRNVTAATALQLALDQSSRTGARLGFATIDGIVRVSSVGRLRHWMTVRIYDVRDLIENAVTLGKHFGNKPTTSHHGWDEPRLAPNYEDVSDTEASVVDRLRNALSKCVKRYPNQPEGDISYFGGRFIITETRQNHEAMGAMLAALRAKPQ